MATHSHHWHPHGQTAGPQQDSFWTPLEQGLHEWDDLCNELLVSDSSTAAGNAVAPSEPQADDQRDSHSSMQATLQKIAAMLSKSAQAQALHGRTSVLLSRQVLACLTGNDFDLLSKTAQSIKESADWVQQVHRLNTELSVQRYSWQQLHAQLMEVHALLQVREEQLLGKDHQVLVLQADLHAAQQQQRSRVEGQRCITSTLQQEVAQLSSELERCKKECSTLRTLASTSVEAVPHAELVRELQLKDSKIQELKRQLTAALVSAAGRQSEPDEAAAGEAAGAARREKQVAAGLNQQLQQLKARLEASQKQHEVEREAAEQQQAAAVAVAMAAAAQQQAEALAAAECRQAAALEVAERSRAAALAEAQQQAELQLESERELAESLSEELQLIQTRLASLQQEHGALKRESTLLAERAIMSEDGLEEARQSMEGVMEAARVQVDALRSELAAMQEHVKELEQGGAGARRQPHASGSGSGNGNGTGHAKRLSGTGTGLGVGAVGSSPVREVGGARGDAGVDTAHVLATSAALAEVREAQARAAALEQELAATRSELQALLNLGRQACEETGLAGEGEGSGARPLWSLLRCAQLLFSREPEGPSLVRVRVLQAQMEEVLQAGLRGGAREPPAMLQELQALRLQQQRLTTGSSSGGDEEAEPHAGMPDDPLPRRRLSYSSSLEASPAARRGASLEQRPPGAMQPVSFDGATVPEASVGRRGCQDPGGEDWGSQGGGGSSASATRSASSEQLMDDDLLQDLNSRWELPPLPPPPSFD